MTSIFFLQPLQLIEGERKAGLSWIAFPHEHLKDSHPFPLLLYVRFRVASGPGEAAGNWALGTG